MAIQTGSYRDASGGILIIADPVAAGIMAVGGPTRFHGDDIAMALRLTPAPSEMLIVSEKSLAEAGYEHVEVGG